MLASSEGEKRARAVGASAATTVSGFVAGAGTAIGGIAGGWAGEEAAKTIGLDDFVADRFGQAFNLFKG